MQHRPRLLIALLAAIAMLSLGVLAPAASAAPGDASVLKGRGSARTPGMTTMDTRAVRRRS